jgi:hypothetical protein
VKEEAKNFLTGGTTKRRSEEVIVTKNEEVQK